LVPPDSTKAADVEPLLRRLADHEIQATIPLNEAVTTI
jgi:hypothetical protein